MAQDRKAAETHWSELGDEPGVKCSRDQAGTQRWEQGSKADQQPRADWMWRHQVTDLGPSECQPGTRLSLPLGPIWNTATTSAFQISPLLLDVFVLLPSPLCSIRGLTTVTLKMDMFIKLTFKIKHVSFLFNTLSEPCFRIFCTLFPKIHSCVHDYVYITLLESMKYD